jgi:transposase InsO family protein
VQESFPLVRNRPSAISLRNAWHYVKHWPQCCGDIDTSCYGEGETGEIRIDNGPEFTSKKLDQWAYFNGVELDFSRPGKPTDNFLIEAFNGRLREECLNQCWFLSLEDAREKVEAWRQEYNSNRPHGALDNLAPEEFADTGG